jgi:DNA-binding IclR family transcriptional regulator
MGKRARAPDTAYTLHTLRKGLAVLEVLAAADEDMSLTELARRLGESSTVVFRLLRTLHEQGFVEQGRVTKRYRVGLKAWEIGSRAARRNGLLELGHPFVKWLAHATGETAMLAVMRGLHVLYLDVAVGSSLLRVCIEPGARAPAYAAASGRAMLAHHPALVSRVVRTRLRAITPRTVTRPAELRRRLAAIRESGISINRGERRQDVTSLAAPVFDAEGQCVAALSVAGPATRFQDTTLEEVERHVRKAAEELSAQLGWPGR